MIKIDNHEMHVSGERTEIIMEFARIMRYIGHDKGLMPKKMMHEFVDASYMSDEELREDSIKKVQDIIDMLHVLDDKDLEELFDEILEPEDCENCPTKDTCKDSPFKKSDSDNTFGDVFKDILGDEP